MDAQPVHVAKLDGRTVKTTWAETEIAAEMAVAFFRCDGARKTKIFRGGIGKYRIVGWW